MLASIGTQIIPAISSATNQADSELSGKKNTTSTLLAIIVPLSVIVLIMVFIMVTIVVIIKWRRKQKIHSEIHQGERN